MRFYFAFYQEVVEAAKKARCHDFISFLTDEYRMHAESSGLKLSGGQRQKICIAGTILKNTPCMLFNESILVVDYHK
ncbi:ATP-binding cassette domain-containing protein [Candidatus Cardinium hertigii]|uniref:Lipid A export ATP-binding/permease protein MsbA n=1 Tax=Candidatus Cardinium hertigii TaxID=247481 RepID=A0A2Z3L8A3_9BACT|nr:ATP-binding cassette domain-containing protein [Candidatus Cardinium hertigii]AWN81649.1 Lipid A export ATP-binding/permease protein MsbA [Candidatus Cardinium hertigii]